ncbi:MAG: hypothetical protein ACPF9H_10350, partial [Aequoribacter sp.]|uniref:BatD family protein n=1 Tax=Aequoribacter sp. TaxID=2847771 RepID=UPI003C59FFD3
LPAQLKTYPDQPVIRDQESRDNLQGERIESTAIIASTPGPIILPEIRVVFWNSKTNTLDAAILPSRTLQVLPRADQEPAGERPRDAFVMAPPPTRDQALNETLSLEDPPTLAPNNTQVWQWISAALACLWVITLAWALATRKQSSNTPREPKVSVADNPLQSAINAARNNDAGSCIQHLHSLANTLSQTQPGLRLEGLGKSVNSSELEQAIQRLLETQYSASPQVWKGSELAQLLREQRQALQKLHQSGQSTDPLALYPT